MGNGNELFERLALWFIWDPSKYPKYSYVEKVKSSSIHKFTFYQLICLGILYALKSIKAVAVVFPFFIASLVFIRWGFAKIFTAEELEALDGHGDEDDEVPCTEPESPLKRVQDPEVDVEPKVKAVGEKIVSEKDDLPVLLGNTNKDSDAKKSADIAEAV